MKIRELLTDESKWTQGTLAEDAKGNRVSVLSPNASSFCLVGAVVRCYDKTTDVVDRIAREVNDEVTNWNDADGRTFEEVKALVEWLDI